MRAATRSRRSCSDFVAAWNKVMNLDRFDLADALKIPIGEVPTDQEEAVATR